MAEKLSNAKMRIKMKSALISISKFMRIKLKNGKTEKVLLINQ